MTITEFLDTELERDTHEYVLNDKYGNIVNINDYDNTQIHNVVYRKIAVITILKNDIHDV